MTSRLAAIFMAIVATSYGWRITFTADPHNHHVQMDTVCEEANGRVTWQAVDEFPVAPGSTSMSVRRHVTPTNVLCHVNVFLFQMDENGDFERVDTAGITE